MSSLIELFGDLPFRYVILFIAVCSFLYELWIKRLKPAIVERDEAKKRTDNKIDMILSKIEKLEEENKEDAKRIGELQDAVKALSDGQKGLEDAQHRFEEEKRQRELNSLRDKILQNHRYYTGDLNPLKKWTEIEKETFEALYKDYLALNGNGYIKNTVHPEMDQLGVVFLADSISMNELMESRKK